MSDGWQLVLFFVIIISVPASAYLIEDKWFNPNKGKTSKDQNDN